MSENPTEKEAKNKAKYKKEAAAIEATSANNTVSTGNHTNQISLIYKLGFSNRNISKSIANAQSIVNIAAKIEKLINKDRFSLKMAGPVLLGMVKLHLKKTDILLEIAKNVMNLNGINVGKVKSLSNKAANAGRLLSSKGVKGRIEDSLKSASHLSKNSLHPIAEFSSLENNNLNNDILKDNKLLEENEVNTENLVRRTIEKLSSSKKDNQSFVNSFSKLLPNSIENDDKTQEQINNLNLILNKKDNLEQDENEFMSILHMENQGQNEEIKGENTGLDNTLNLDNINVSSNYINRDLKVTSEVKSEKLFEKTKEKQKVFKGKLIKDKEISYKSQENPVSNIQNKNNFISKNDFDPTVNLLNFPDIPCFTNLFPYIFSKEFIEKSQIFSQNLGEISIGNSGNKIRSALNLSEIITENLNDNSLHFNKTSLLNSNTKIPYEFNMEDKETIENLNGFISMDEEYGEIKGFEERFKELIDNDGKENIEINEQKEAPQINNDDFQGDQEMLDQNIENYDLNSDQNYYDLEEKQDLNDLENELKTIVFSEDKTEKNFNEVYDAIENKDKFSRPKLFYDLLVLAQNGDVDLWQSKMWKNEKIMVKLN